MFSSWSLVDYSLQDPTGRLISKTLPGHAAQITTVKHIPWNTAPSEGNQDVSSGPIVSGDEQGNIILWTVEDDQDSSDDPFAYRERWTKKSHEGSISSLGVYTDRNDPNMGLIMSGGNDGRVKIYRWRGRSSKVEVEEVQTLKMGGRMPLDLVITNLPDSNGTSYHICLFSSSSTYD